MTKSYQLILLDMDETIFDFSKAEALSLRRALKRCGVPHDEEKIDEYQRINAALWKEIEAGRATTQYVRVERFARYLKKFGLTGDPDRLSDTYIEELAASPYLIDGAKEFMAYLHQKYKICIVTNGIQTNQYSRMEKSGLLPYCDAMVVSEEAGAAKPSTAIFEAALTRSAHTDKKTVLMIGDSLSSDIRGGLDFGVDTLWYNPKRIVNETRFLPTYEAADYEEIKTIV